MKQMKLTYKVMKAAEANLFAENLLAKLKANDLFANLPFEGLEKGIEQLLAATGLQRGIIRTHQVTEARQELNRQLDMLLTQVHLKLTQQNLSQTDYITQVNELGLNVRGSKNRAKRRFSAEPGTEDGTMKLYAEAGAHAYLWEFTDDVTNFNNRRELMPTWLSQTEVTGLKRGITYAFFHRPIGPKASNNWEGPLLKTM